MTTTSKAKSCSKPVVDFESNSKSVKRNKRLHSKKYQSCNHTNNQQVCINCLKPRSNKNERQCKKCRCDHFYVSSY